MDSTCKISTDAMDDASLVATDVTACLLILVSPVLDGALRVCDCSIGCASLLLLFVVVVVGPFADHNVFDDAGSIIVL